jgi:hypothetical protein
MRVRFATVPFQTGTSMTSGSPPSAVAMWIFLVLEVIFSMAHMKISAMIEMPRKLNSKSDFAAI